MDKNNARPRRTPVQLTSEPAGAAGTASREGSPTAAGPAAAPPAQDARRRIEDAAQRNPGEGAALLPDAILQERNDVLAVINELEDQLDRQQALRETLERDLKATHERFQAAQQRAQELEWQQVTFQTRIAALEQLRQEVAELESQLTDVNTKAQRAAESAAQVEQERDRLAGELKNASKQLEELWTVRKERDTLRGESKTLAARIEELDRGLHEIQEERSALQTRLADAQAQLDEARNEKHETQLALRASDERIRELQRAQDDMADKLETLRAEKKSLHAHTAQLERENARLVEQRQYYERELTSLRNSNRTAEAALANIKKAFAEVRIALTGTSAKVRRRTMESIPRSSVYASEAYAAEDPAMAGAEAPDLDPSTADDFVATQRVIAQASAAVETLAPERLAGVGA